VATKKYKIKNTNILHNGDLYKIGDVIELDDKQATKLQDVLTVVKETSTTNKNQNKTKTENSEKSGGENGK
jgi:flagellar basal body L-ring protein FlgH